MAKQKQICESGKHVPVIVHRTGGECAELRNRCGKCGLALFRDTPTREWKTQAEIEGVPCEPDRVNVYVCPDCRGYTVTIDIHTGVTPFMLRCRAKGGCRGMAQSSFYPKERPIPPHIPAPAWEWFKPTGEDYLKLNEAMQEHVDKGGLDIRLRPC